MKRIVCALWAAIAMCIVMAPQAHAASDEITRFDVHAIVDAAGTFTVTQTIDVSYGSQSHGPYIWYMTRQSYNDEYDRRITYSDFEVTSPTGAPTETLTTEADDTIRLRIGDPDITVSGTHTYVLTYTVTGIVNPNVEESNYDEIFWNVVGTGWEIPILNVTVTLEGPAPVSDTTCHMGRSFGKSCTSHSHSGSTATFTQYRLDPGEGLAIVAGWPVGTFPDAEIDLVPVHRDTEFTRVDISGTLDAYGQLHVTQEFDVWLDDDRDSFTVVLPSRATYSADLDQLLTHSDFEVTTISGSQARVQVGELDNNRYVFFYLSDPAIGKHSYRLTYTVAGVVDSGANQDRFIWPIVNRQGYDMPLKNLSVTIEGLAPVISATSDPLDVTIDGNRAHGSAAVIEAYKTVILEATWPSGTYPNTSFTLEATSTDPFDLQYGGALRAGIAAAVTGGVAWLLTRLRRRGFDRQFANVPPGMLPVEGEKAEIKIEEVKNPPVAFEPPKGIPPRLVGAVWRQSTEDIDVTATIIDLAVRGCLHINQHNRRDFTLVARVDPQVLPPVERRIYQGLFRYRNSITRAEMASENFYATFIGFLSVMKKELDHQKWFTGSDNSGRIARLLGFLVFSIGGLSTMTLMSNPTTQTRGFGWFLIPVLVLGMGLILLSSHLRARTPTGSAVAIQAGGFKKYLETAEAKQIRWEEDNDIFSRYLPYAIVFGCAERWVKLFDEMVTAGVPVTMPTWYSGDFRVTGSSMKSISESVSSVQHAFDSTIRAHAAEQRSSFGSSGGSGFSSGGSSDGGGSSGGGGGGVGGGGGGTW